MLHALLNQQQAMDIMQQQAVLDSPARQSVHLAAWGSNDASGTHEDLQAFSLTSTASAGSPEAARGSGSSSSSTASQSSTHDLLGLQPLVAAALEADQAPLQQARTHAKGHRSLPGVPDLYPQEVLVKVQVTQRSNAELSSKPSPWQQQQQQQRIPASVHAKGLQEQAPLAPKPRPSQQDASPKGAGSADAAAIACAELQGLLSQGADPIDPGSAVQPRSSCSNTRTSSASPSQEQKQRAVPLLDLSRAQLGTKGPAAVKGVPEPQPLTRTQAERDDELCLDISNRRSITLHPNAPMQDNRCYHYKAMGSKDNATVQALLDRLSQPDAQQVQGIWDALLIARRDCEAMAARGVRVSRDISRDWQETVSDLIDRVVAQDSELAQLRHQLKAVQQAPAPCSTAASANTAAATAAAASGNLSGSRPSSAAGSNISSMEDLHGQVVRLKRHRDRLMRDQQELSRQLAEVRLELQGAQHKAAEATDQLAAFQQQAQDLRDQHVGLLQQHIELAAYAEGLEATITCMQHNPASGYVLTQPVALAPAVLAPAAYVPGQAMGWVLHNGSQGLCMGLQAAGRTSSAPLGARQSLHAQPGLRSPGRLQAPRRMQSPAPVALAAAGIAAAAPATPAAVPAAAAGGVQADAAAGSDHSTAVNSAPPGAASQKGWLQSSLAGLAHLGRSHGSRRSHRSGLSPAKAAAGSAQVSAEPAPADGGGCLSAATKQGRTSAAVHRECASAAVQRCGSAAVRSTLEQAAAVVTAAVAAAGSSSLGPSRRAVASCPGKVSGPSQPWLGSDRNAVGGAHLSHLAAGASVDIPHGCSSGHSPRARGHGTCSKAPCVPGSLGTSSYIGDTSQSMGSPRDDADSDADGWPAAGGGGQALAAPVSSRNFDQLHNAAMPH